jgi:ABC-type multidrug transport system permease subunit
VRKKKRVGNWIWLLVLLALIIGALVFLEHLGSEQTQKMVEQPVAVPAIQTKSEMAN